MADFHAELIEDLARFSHDPLGFTMWNWPWGEPGTELEKFPRGPDQWSVDLLGYIGDQLRRGSNEPIQIGTTSGHGVGKSATVSWINNWAISTFEDTRGVITANTENQLKTKTWVEMGKWHRLGLTADLLKFTATAIFSADPEREKGWRIDMIPWSEKNTEAFAGLHNKGKRIVVTFDEASAIADQIFDTTEGALTDDNTEILWLLFGNPTRNKGYFRNVFPGGRYGHRWKSFRVDSREVRITNKAQIERWIADRGEDSDFVRVRVRGEFPRLDSVSFIDLERVKEAIARKIPEGVEDSPVVLGVDVARFGNNPSVITARQGRDARSRQPRIYPSLSVTQLCQKIFEAWLEWNPVMIFIDEGGVGGGVVDLCAAMNLPVMGVNFGSLPDLTNPVDPLTNYVNKRAEMWGAMREWLSVGCIPYDIPGYEGALEDELIAPGYKYNKGETAIALESKAEMIARGAPSPDWADSLALTFAFPVLENIRNKLPSGFVLKNAQDYDPFSVERMA